MKLWSSRSGKEEASLPSEAPARLLGLVDLSAVGVGSSFAFGAWVLVGHLINGVAGPAVVVSVALAGLAAVAGGLCLAEFGVRFLKADSVYVYCYLNNHQSSAFVFGWGLLLQYLAGTASGAKGAIVFIDSLTQNQTSDFLSRVASLNSLETVPYFDFISFIVIGVVVTLIAFEIKDSMAVKKIFTICTVILVILVIMAGAFRADLRNWYSEGAPDEEGPYGFTPFGIWGVAKGAAMAFYGFVGFDSVSITGFEVKRRKRNVPLAIAATTLVTLAAYAGLGTVLTLMLPFHEHDSHAAIPFAFQQAGWIVLKWAVVAATFLSFQTSLFGAAFAFPRVIQAMANDGLLFHCLGNGHPAAASVTGGLVAALAAGFLSFEDLVKVTVISALFVLSVLATQIVVLRYTPMSSSRTECSPQPCFAAVRDENISVKSALQNLFNFTQKSSTNLTKKIVMGNLISIYFSSVGLSLIFRYLHEPIMEGAVAGVVPTGVFIIILLLNVISIACQPKSEESAPFKVPLVPLVPCLSIFLNTFFMLSFEPTTWIVFSSWLALGVVPYSVWRCVKLFRKEYDENSLYDINKVNTIKLSESIWKIKSNKKSFYEGAVNPVFVDDDEPCANGELKKIDAIEKAELEENPPEKKLEVKFAYIEHEELVPRMDNVSWECAAEIHEEESVALEIVDNTYNFLSEISKDDASQSLDKPAGILENLNLLDCVSGKETQSETSLTESTGCIRFTPQQPEGLSLKDELLIKIKERMKNSKLKENIEENLPEKEFEEVSYETSEELPSAEIKLRNEKDRIIYSKSDTDDNNNSKELQESVRDEQNRVKQFKEKLNKLLKNQMNEGVILTKNLKFLKANFINGESSLSELNDDTDKKILNNSIKTLNKSQIKGKLEVLLAKGPPKRSTLSSSFNIKTNETDEQTKFQNDAHEEFEKTSTDNNEKILSSDKSELSNDVIC